MLLRILFISFAYFTVNFSVFCQSYYEIRKLLPGEINKITKNKNIELSFTLFSPKGTEIYSYNPTKNLTPASTLKIYTTGAALTLLGSNFKYSTSIEHDGYIDHCGILYGNIFITGSGDPTLGSERFPGNPSLSELINLFSDEIKKLGITGIKGNIIGDNSYFSDCLTPDSWPLDDRANYYGAAPNGLTVNENSYKLFFEPGKTIGSSTQIISTDPVKIPGLMLKNEVTTFHPGSGDRAVIMEDPFNPYKEVIGTIPAGVNTFYIKGSIPDPAQLAAKLLFESLSAKGISIEGSSFNIFNCVEETSEVRNKIYTHLSPSLIDIVTQVNMRSHNLFAETLTITLGKVFRGVGNHEKGLETVFEYWDSKGIGIRKAEIYDGSGLSPLNKISSRILTQMLFSIQKDDSFESFLSTLPVVGVSGTLKNFCKYTSAKGKIFAKSGSIEGVKSYAGYAITHSGDYLPFSLIINHHEANLQSLNTHLEKIMEVISNVP